MTSLALYSGVYVLRVMVSSPFYFLAVFYHVHDNFSSCGLKLWDHYSAVNGKLASIIKNQFYAGCVYVELTGYKFAHGQTSKMFFEVNQAVNSG